MRITRRLDRDTGFTVIELLVVISIIGILAGMLLPALGKARDRAKSASCISSLHQWGLASNLYLYMDDNDDLIPLDTDSGGSDNPNWGQVVASTSVSAWYNVLPPYVQKPRLGTYAANPALLYKSANILQCPDVQWGSPPIGAAAPRFSYAYNSKILGTSHPAARRRDL